LSTLPHNGQRQLAGNDPMAHKRKKTEVRAEMVAGVPHEKKNECMGWRLTPQMHVHGTACRAVDTANHTFSDLQNRTVETAPACPIIRSTLSAFKFGPHAFAMVVKASKSKRSFDPVLVRGPKAEKDVSWQSTGYIEDQHGVMRKDGWQYQSKIKTKIITARTPTAYINHCERCF